MLARAALHQTRFRTPGVSPDARGVILGQKGVLLFPSLDRLVAFFRAYSNNESLDELLPGMEIRNVVTALKTREIVLSVVAESSYRMDRISGTAKLVGGMVFTGSSRHFVKYRDSNSPLGYDLERLADDPSDLVLYHDSFQQGYSFERELLFSDLILKLSPQRIQHNKHKQSERLFVTAKLGIGPSVISYLFRWRIEARAGLSEWRSDSAFDDDPNQVYLFEVAHMPERIVRLFSEIPGITLFEPMAKNVGVELGFQHPISLDSCASVFETSGLFLFHGSRSTNVTIVDPVPELAPLRSLVRIELNDDSAPTKGTIVEEDMNLSLELKLAYSTEPFQNVVAVVVPKHQREWLARMLYTLPPTSLTALSMAVSEDQIFLIDPAGIEGVPLGLFYSEIAPRIYVPTGLTLVPAVSSAVLNDLLHDRGDGHVFFQPGSSRPSVVAKTSFGPVSRKALRQVSLAAISANRPDIDETPLPLMQYGEVRRFPLWGVVGKKPPKDPQT